MTRARDMDVPLDPRHPSDEYLERELNDDRRGEYRLLPKTVFALVFVAVLVVIRQVFFV
ncbi:MAG TPA: hypothetical protein VGM94_14925 [Galbitalea sp.]|jgi:hypothetical protein